MQNRVYSQELVDRVVDELKITDLEQATIGQVVLLASRLEELTGIPFIRMDQGVPGLEPCRIGTEAEKQALDTWIPAIYPAAEGIPELKTEASRFVKAFLDVDISAAACVPVTGSVAGSFGSFIACTQCDPGKNTVLFIDPGFPIQKSQLKVLGIPHVQFDVHDFRGEKLRAKLESYLEKGNIAGIIYSNPNNPAWISLTESELQVLGELATRYGAVVLEDLAYFGMDFRSDFGRPFEPPYIPTAARYTDNYILMLSSSKIFSYAGQRAAMLCISDSLFGRRFPALAERYAGAGIIKTVDECTPRHLDEAARSGCPIALQLWEDTAEMLGCLIMNLMYTLVPDAFIIGGGVAKAGDLLMKPLLENLRKQLFPLLMEDLKILPARFGAEAGLLGAGAMAMDEFMGMGILERFKNQKSTQTFC